MFQAQFDCKCSYIEIYNEAIYDLLDCSAGSRVCSLREDSKRGNAVFVEDCTMARVRSPLEALELFALGAQNRHVASTAMNRESSRSHAVFTIYLQGKWQEGELLDVRESRFNMVDLAGSERQQLTGTVGVRLKEAGNINKSLLALSNVINALVETAGGRPRHVHYRDSKLTFLLKDSLGGNSKTCIVACVSPSPFSLGETLSTLRFAQRAKLIRNQVIMNKDLRGDTHQLQSEIRRLQAELAAMKSQSPRQEEYAPSHGEELKMLKIAMERQTELANEVMKLKEALESTEELCRRKDYQVHSERMLRKLREAALNESGHLNLSEEVMVLQGMLDHHPDVVRFAIDNTRLRERLGQLDQLTISDFDALQNQLQRQQTHIDQLTQKLMQQESETSESKKPRLSIDDVKIIELQGHVDSLREELERFRERVNELESVEVDLRQGIVRLEKEKAVMVEEKQRFEAETTAKIGELIQRKDYEIEALKNGYSQSEEATTQLKAQMAILKESHQQQLEHVNRLAQSKLEQQASMASSEKDELQKHYNSEMTRLKDSITRLQQSLTQSQQNVEKMTLELETARLRIGDLEAQLQQNQCDQQNQQQAEPVNSEEMYVLRLELAHLRKTISDWESKYQEVDASLKTKEVQVTQLESSLQSSQSQLSELSEKLQTVTQTPKIDETRHKLVLAENLQHLQKINKLEHMLRHATEELATVTANASSNDAPRVLELQGELEALRVERDTLQEANAKLIQHHNAKQKLHYHVKIKEENNQLRAEIQTLQAQLAKYMDGT